MNEASRRVVSEYQRRLPGISDGGLVRLMQGQRARIAAAQAHTLELIAELHGRDSMRALDGRSSVEPLPREAMVEAELRAGLGLSAYAAQKLVAAALALDERLFTTMILLRAGGIDLDRVQVITKHAVPLAEHVAATARRAGAGPAEADEQARAVMRRLEEIVLPEAAGWSLGRLERETIAAVTLLAPAYAHEQQQLALRSRSVSRPRSGLDDPHGQHMSEITARLATPEANAVWRTLDTYARTLRHHGDERTLDQLRADTFTHLILRGHPPTEIAGREGSLEWSAVAGFDRYGLRANIEVTVSLETLLGVSEAPAELEGHPITAHQARALAFAAGSTWRRLVTDEHGHLLDYGSTRYAPPPPLKRHVRARDRYCRTPGCDRPAAGCDIDHLVPHPAGPTAAGNLHCKCRRCHRLKHEGRWRHEILDPANPVPVTTDADFPRVRPGAVVGNSRCSGLREIGFPPGTIRITSPTGLEYYSAPVDLRRHQRHHDRRGAPAAPAQAGRAPATGGGDPPF
jgi:uncharacterized protein DUF222